MPTVTIDNTVIEGATEASDTSGMNTPTKKTESGFEFTTFVDTKPTEISIQAIVERSSLRQIASKRESAEPVSASIGTTTIPRASVESIEVSQRGDLPEQVEVSIELREIRTPSAGTATIVNTGDGSAGGSGSDSAGFTETTSDSSGTGESVEQNSSGGGGGGGGGNFVASVIGDASQAISDTLGL